MAVFAHVYAPAVVCPNCNDPLAVGDSIGFQWGYCSSPRHAPGWGYEIGDEIRWRIATNGTVPAWSYFEGHRSANIGDAQFCDVLIRETELDLRTCQSCNHRHAGIAVSIRAGTIESVKAFEFELPNADISIIHQTDGWSPQAGWNDHAMADALGGRRTRFITPSHVATD